MAVTLLVGTVMHLPGWDAATGRDGIATMMAAAALMAVAVTPVGWVAGRTRGYLPALATALAILAATQVAAALGWAELIPWAVPALAAGLVPGQRAGTAAIGVCLATGLIGVVATVRCWNSRDTGL